jgi:hypothetical protein
MNEATARKIEDEEVPQGVEISAARTEAARSFLKHYRKDEGLEKVAVARKLGYADSGRNRVHRFLEGADDPGLVLAVERLRVTVEGSDGIQKYVGFRETRCAKIVINFARKIRSAGLFGAIVGPCGAGKTEALKKFQQDSKNDGLPPVRIIRCHATDNLPGVVGNLAEDLGLKRGETSKVHREIVRRLAGRPEFLIVDEVDHLLHNERSLHFFRDLWDEIGVGVLFSGQMYFLSEVWQRAANGHHGGEEGRLGLGGPLAAFADRLRVEMAVGLDDEEIIDIACDVLKMDLTDEAAKRLLVFANKNFRALTVVIQSLREIRQKAGRQIDHRAIEAAWARARHIKSTR